MSRRAPLPRDLELDVERLAQGGEGVARHPGGKVVFVTGALPGERVRATLTDERRRFARARLDEVLVASPLRRAPDCTHEAAGCGGCGLRHVVDAHALCLKAEAAHAELTKLAPAVTWPPFTLHPAPALDAWRTRVRLHVRDGRLGFFARASHDLVEVGGARSASRPPLGGPPQADGGCLAMTDALRAAMREVAQVVAALPAAERPSSVLLEQADNGCFAFWDASFGARTRDLLGQRIAPGSPLTGARAADGEVLGAPWMLETAEACGQPLTLTRRAGSFGQASPAANRTLRALVAGWLEALAPLRRVTDLYAGSGNFALLAATCCPGARVDAVELGPDALEGLEHAAQHNALAERVHVHRADLRHGLPSTLTRGQQPPELVILDPPRSGARDVIDGLLELAAPHIVYVSCGPTTLARDLGALAGAYRIAEAHAVDMFPRTPHLELAVRLERAP